MDWVGYFSSCQIAECYLAEFSWYVFPCEIEKVLLVGVCWWRYSYCFDLDNYKHSRFLKMWSFQPGKRISKQCVVRRYRRQFGIWSAWKIFSVKLLILSDFTLYFSWFLVFIHLFYLYTSQSVCAWERTRFLVQDCSLVNAHKWITLYVVVH